MKKLLCALPIFLMSIACNTQAKRMYMLGSIKRNDPTTLLKELQTNEPRQEDFEQALKDYNPTILQMLANHISPDFTRISEGLYEANITHYDINYNFYAGRVTKHNFHKWEQFISKQEEKLIKSYNRDLAPGIYGFQNSLKLYKRNKEGELWITYLLEGKRTNGFLVNQLPIISMTFMTSKNSPLAVHMGITRQPEYMMLKKKQRNFKKHFENTPIPLELKNKELEKHRGLSTLLHKIVSLWVNHLYNVSYLPTRPMYMHTRPTNIMSLILRKKLLKSLDCENLIWVGDKTYREKFPHMGEEISLLKNLSNDLNSSRDPNESIKEYKQKTILNKIENNISEYYEEMLKDTIRCKKIDILLKDFNDNFRVITRDDYKGNNQKITGLLNTIVTQRENFNGLNLWNMVAICDLLEEEKKEHKKKLKTGLKESLRFSVNFYLNDLEPEFKQMTELFTNTSRNPLSPINKDVEIITKVVNGDKLKNKVQFIKYIKVTDHNGETHLFEKPRCLNHPDVTFSKTRDFHTTIDYFALMFMQ